MKERELFTFPVKMVTVETNIVICFVFKLNDIKLSVLFAF